MAAWDDLPPELVAKILAMHGASVKMDAMWRTLWRGNVWLAIAIGLQEQPSFVAITRMSGLNHALEVVISVMWVIRMEASSTYGCA
eukprot:scaffold392_cov101-Isochrysis_galbana.AAC.18